MTDTNLSALTSDPLRLYDEVFTSRLLLGTARYLFRLHFRGGGGDPTEELLRDPVLGATALGWLATVLWVIG